VTFSSLLDTPYRSLVFAEALILMLLIGYVDYLTSWEWSLFVFYALPILLLARRGELKLALVVAVLCGAVWLLANTGTHPYRTVGGFVWASINRLAYFIFVAIGGTAVHNQRQEMEARLEASQRARSLEHEIVRISEREQMRLGQDLHDGLCQRLAAIECAATCLKVDLEVSKRSESQAASAIQGMLKDAIVEARNLARGISPVHADAEDLPAVLEELTLVVNQEDGPAVTFAQAGDIRRLEAQTALHLYRIAQEAVRNAVKHAEPTRIDIELRQDDAGLHLEITDNGRGFARTTGSKGMGLGTMRYRARLVGAELAVKERIEGGTVVSCTLPLAHADAI
jgi:signal transduction histidine kinase